MGNNHKILYLYFQDNIRFLTNIYVFLLRHNIAFLFSSLYPHVKHQPHRRQRQVGETTRQSLIASGAAGRKDANGSGGDPSATSILILSVILFK